MPNAVTCGVQLVEETKGTFVVFTRWGRTGTAGACKLESFDEIDKAEAQFAKMFLAKTGVDWEDQDDYEPQCAPKQCASAAEPLVGTVS